MDPIYTGLVTTVQSLPTRTATCVVYLLLGALPVEAELHKRQLSLLYNILVSKNETIVELTKHQIAINLDNELSFYCRVHDILYLYNLPPLAELQTDIPSKDQCKQAVNAYWTEKLQEEVSQKSTLVYLKYDSLKISESHSVWTSLESTVSDV